MNLATIISSLEQIETLSVYTVRAKESSVLPYGVFIYGSRETFKADNKTFFDSGDPVSFELYTKAKDLSLEAKVEKVFDENEIPYDTDEAFDDGEQFYIKYYNF